MSHFKSLRRHQRGNAALAFLGMVLFFGLWLAGIAGWITHIIVCIKSASYLLLIAGALIFPVGMIHGIGCWFGAW